MTTTTEVYSSLVEQPSKPARAPFRLWLAVLVLSFSGGVHFGFHLVITNPAQDAFIAFLRTSMQDKDGQPPLSESDLNTKWSSYVSLLYFGSLIGAFFIKVFADKLGRKKATIVTTAGQALSCCLAVAAYMASSHVLYAVSRFVLGFFQAIAMGIGPMYISEASPAAIRGIISLSTGLFVQISIIVGSIVAMPNILGTPDSWWIMYAIEVAIFAVVLCALPFIPESPSFLCAQGENEAAARSLSFFHGVRGLQLHTALNELQHEISNSSESLGLLAIWRDKKTRMPTLTGCVVMFAMISSGIVVINGYAVAILMKVGLSSTAAAWANVAICCIMVVGCLLSSVFVDRFGRRPLLLVTIAVIILLNVVIVLLMHLFDATKDTLYGQLLLAAICVFAVVFCTGPAPLSFFISAELVGQDARGSTMTWAAVIMAAFRTVVLAIFPPLAASLGSALSYFVLFVPSVVVAFVFLFFYLPETKDIGTRQQQLQEKKLLGDGKE